MTLAELPEERIKTYQAIIRRVCSAWRRHPEFEELPGEAWLEAEATLQRNGWPEGRDGETLVYFAATYRIRQYMRSPKNPHRKINSVGKPVAPLIWLDAAPTNAWFGAGGQWDGELFTADNRRDYLLGCEPDFAPGLIERLDRERVWQEFWATVPEAERDFILAVLRGAVTVAEAGRQQGRARCSVQRNWQRALNRYRRRIGVSLKKDGVRNQGLFDAGQILLSAEDEWRRLTHEWKLHRGNGCVYRVQPGEWGKGLVYLHNELATLMWGPAPGREVDFIDGNRLNLTRPNLRRQARGTRWELAHQQAGPQVERKRQWYADWHQQNKEERNARARERYWQQKQEQGGRP